MKQWKGWRMSCDVGKATEGLENELWRRWSDGKVGEWAELARWIKWKACDVGEAKWGLENELWHRWSDEKVGESAELFLQPFRQFTYVTTHSPTLASLYLRHSSFSNPSVASSTSQLILQSFFSFSYVTGSSLTSPGEPPMLNIHSLIYNEICV